ncbi:unnamed protein product [Adineta steineri]|uniref:protein-tyrosine-phosphatase n=1 Tax=Adineta steineri TaxID=433720 RepID=A0A813WPQ0_9BILA|nr:unnamed protein product [Adineta steineri]CAF1550633.1 unnamed protein product [Adineta steineri]
MPLSSSSYDYSGRRRNSEQSSEILPVSAAVTKAMPMTRVTEHNSDSLSTNPLKSSSVSHFSTQYEENSSNNEKHSTKKQIDSPKKSNGSYQKPSASTHTQRSESPRRVSIHYEGGLPQMRGRSNTDVQSFLSLSNNLKSQQSNINGSGSDRAINHSLAHGPIRPKPKCILPATASGQPGYVTASKLFNMMGYGLQNQYLFMLAHYLYIIDCRTKEKFDENHIITAIHWEDALDGTVYISLVERFSEIVLYDDHGIVFNTTTEMNRVSNRFITSGSKLCLVLSGGFPAFHALFPFLCTKTDVRSIVDREKFLTIYPSVVLDDQLYLGTGHQATNWKVVRDLKITHIINISFEHQCVFPDKITYLHLQLEDMEDVLLKDRFGATIQFMETAFENSSNRILVHCNLGISRSTTVTLAYLMKTYNATLTEAYKFVRQRRPIVCPNLGFLRQLFEYECELFGQQYSNLKDKLYQ